MATLSTYEESIAVDIKTNRMKLMDNFDGKNNCVIFNTEQSEYMGQNSCKFETKPGKQYIPVPNFPNCRQKAPEGEEK